MQGGHALSRADLNGINVRSPSLTASPAEPASSLCKLLEL